MNNLAQLEVTNDGLVYVGRIAGEIDVSNARDILAELMQSIPNTAGAFVLDLSETTHVDSAGVRILFELGRRLGDRQQTGRLVVPEGSIILRLLKLAQIGEAFELRGDLADATRELHELVPRETREN